MSGVGTGPDASGKMGTGSSVSCTESMDTTIRDARVSLGFETACLIAQCCGILLVAAAFRPLPLAVLLVGLVLLIAGTLLITGLAVAVSRVTCKSVTHSA